MVARPEIQDIADTFKESYRHLGNVASIEALSFDFTVVSAMFSVQTESGVFLIKRTPAPDAFFGDARSLDRLELVARATTALRQQGLLVEEIVAADDGCFVRAIGTDAFRVYRFLPYRHYDGTGRDRRAAAESLQRVHREGASALGPQILNELATVTQPYPLDTLLPHLSEIGSRLQSDAGTEPLYPAVRADWPLITAAASRSVAYRRRSGEDKGVVHTDVHPRNVLYDPQNGEATLIDFDALMLDRPFRDLGFSVLRFSDIDAPLSELLAAMRRWASAYANGDSPEFEADLLHAMLGLETEKAIRILYRYQTKGTHGHLVKNVSRIHIRNIKRVTSLLDDGWGTA